MLRPPVWLFACASVALGCGAPAAGFAPFDASTSDATQDATQDGAQDAAAGDATGDATTDGHPADVSAHEASASDSPSSDALSGDGGGSPEDGASDAPAYVFAPTQNIGANLPFLFLGFLGLAPGGATTASAALDDAKAAGITHVRFIASGFYPTDMTQSPGWVADPASYWAAFDATIAAAAAHGIRVVPSILWNPYLFPDINGEPMSQLFVKGSKSRTMAEKYVTELVTRYASSDAILYWELGNELNLSADIDVSNCGVCDGGTSYCAGIDPPRGTPCGRTAADEYYSCNACRGADAGAPEDLAQLESDLGALVASYDPTHPISSGNSYPRPSAWHLAASPCPSCDWTLDTQAQFQIALLQENPNALAVLSVHHYPGPDLARFGSDDQTGGALLALTQQIASAAGKTLYVGEFGQTRGGTVSCNGTLTCGGEATWAQTRWVLDDLVASQVPRAAIWGFDFFQFCPGVPTCDSVVPSDPIVPAIATHNAAFGACGADAGAGGDGGCPIGDCIAGLCTPAPKATFAFATTADVTSWTLWTNCTGCTNGTDALLGADGGANGYVELASNTLPCTGSCTFPGVYALSPAFQLPGPHGLLRFDARASAGAVLDVISYDASGTNELGHTTVSVPAGNSFTEYALWFNVPVGAVTASVRLELTTPSATFDVQDIAIVSEP